MKTDGQQQAIAILNPVSLVLVRYLGAGVSEDYSVVVVLTMKSLGS